MVLLMKACSRVVSWLILLSVRYACSGIRSLAGQGADEYAGLEVHEGCVSSKKKTPRAKKESNHENMSPWAGKLTKTAGVISNKPVPDTSQKHAKKETLVRREQRDSMHRCRDNPDIYKRESLGSDQAVRPLDRPVGEYICVYDWYSYAQVSGSCEWWQLLAAVETLKSLAMAMYVVYESKRPVVERPYIILCVCISNIWSDTIRWLLFGLWFWHTVSLFSSTSPQGLYSTNSDIRTHDQVNDLNNLNSSRIQSINKIQTTRPYPLLNVSQVRRSCLRSPLTRTKGIH
jgi:hypothetical protein